MGEKIYIPVAMYDDYATRDKSNKNLIHARKMKRDLQKDYPKNKFKIEFDKEDGYTITSNLLKGQETIYA